MGTLNTRWENAINDVCCISIMMVGILKFYKAPWWFSHYRKVPKFSDARKLCCKLSKIQTKRFYPGVIPRKDANRKANSEDPDQTAPLFAQTHLSEN